MQIRMKRKGILRCAAAALLFGAAIGALTAVAPWVGDDIEYQYMCVSYSPDTGDVPVMSAADVFVSQANHYFGTNGRMVPHVLVQFFCALWGQPAFVVCNAAVYVLFVFMLLAVSRRESLSRCRVTAFFATAALTMVGFSTFYTPAFQIGYVWMFTATLAFLWLFFSSRCHGGAVWWALPVGLLAGWGQEAIAIGVAGALCLFAVFRRDRMTPQRRLLLAGYLTGVLLICLSPATRGRAAATDVPLAVSMALLFRYMRITYFLLAFAGGLLLFRRAALRDMFKRNAFYWNAWGITLLFNLVIGIVPQARQLFGLELLSVVLLLRLWTQYPVTPRLRWALLTLVIVCGTVEYGRRLSMQLDMRATYDNIIADCRRVPDGGVVYSRFARGNELWPGGAFALTIEKHVRIRMGKHVHIVPAPGE